MECPYCEYEMVKETSVTDYHDPSDPHGHGQYEQEHWYCQNCDHIEPVEDENE